MRNSQTNPLVAIACGGTGGHLFPGLAVAEQLLERGCDVLLIVSPKEVDQQAVKGAVGMEVFTLPAVGLQRGALGAFVGGFAQSLKAAKKKFRERPPQAVLAMGGFTSAPPVLAGRSVGAVTFLHESNMIPGKANRWLSHFVDEAFVGFPESVNRLWHPRVVATGTPVRPQFQPMEAASCRMALGLAPERAVLLIMGGSQGASGINQLVAQSLPLFAQLFPRLQYLHLTGANDVESVREAYRSHKIRAVVQPFLTEMEMALAAATAVISRSGASSLAELAAMRVPSVLIPYPHATDNHQYHNALAYVESGAAALLPQKGTQPDMLVARVGELLTETPQRAAMVEALAAWDHPEAAARIAKHMLWTMSQHHPYVCQLEDATHALNPSRLDLRTNSTEVL